MNKFIVFFAGFLLGFPGPASFAASPTPDVVMQKVLKEYGVDSKVLKSYAALVATSPRKDGLFLIRIDGSPGFEVVLDWDYWVLSS